MASISDIYKKKSISCDTGYKHWSLEKYVFIYKKYESNFFCQYNSNNYPTYKTIKGKASLSMP
jgi:hypothetical protein